MSVDLVVANDIGSSTQAIEDQNGNQSGLFISSTTANLTTSGRLVFGIGGYGVGEWLQNSSNATGNNFGIAFYGNSKERMRMTNAGNLGVGTDSPTATLHVSGSVRFQGLAAGSGNDLVVDSDGNVSIQGSSARFKENVRKLKDDFAKLLSLEPVAFRYKESGAESIGYLAEEVAEQGLEDLVSRDGEGAPTGVHYKLIPVYLVELARQQQALIEGLQEKLAELQGRFDGVSAIPATE